MNKAKKLQFTILTTAIFTGTIAVVSAFYQENAQATPTVTISAKRMTVDEKIAYDTELFGQTQQTVLISAKRITTLAQGKQTDSASLRSAKHDS